MDIHVEVVVLPEPAPDAIKAADQEPTVPQYARAPAGEGYAPRSTAATVRPVAVQGSNR